MGRPLVKDHDRVCFLGDSITDEDPGYTRLLAALLTATRPDLPLEFMYAGVSGHRVGDLLERLDRDALAPRAHPRPPHPPSAAPPVSRTPPG